jgi:RHS repeat-associated protein
MSHALILSFLLLLIILQPLSTSNTNYIYDVSDCLPQIKQPTDTIYYWYDHNGIRVGKQLNTTLYRYLVDSNRPYAQVLEEYEEDTLAATYVYGDDLISQNRGDLSYYLYDGQLSTRQLIDDTGVVTDSYDYDAFGNLLNSSGTTVNNYRYTGEQFDPNAGFYYLRARYYDQGTGRFTSVDPYSGNMHEPVTLHRYLYAGNNPVMNRDPSGEVFTLGELSAANSIRSSLTELQINTAFSILDANEGAEDEEYISNEIKSTLITFTFGVAFKAIGPVGIGTFYKSAKNITTTKVTLKEAKELVGKWSKEALTPGRSGFKKRADAIREHVEKHGNGDVWKYLRQAANFNYKRTRPIDLGDGKVKYIKKGKYIILDDKGKILSYGGVDDRLW